MLGATQTVFPWADIIIAGASVVAAFGAFIAVPMYMFFLKDRQKVLLRQEVEDERRRREQLETRTSELTKERDTLRDSLSDERKKPDVQELAATLKVVAETLAQVADTDTKILDKLASLNGGLSHANEGLQASRTAMEFLASQLVLRDPKLLPEPPPVKT